MNIYVNGCSHTRGTIPSLPNPDDAYPKLLQKEFGGKLIDKSTRGGSNDKIIRETISDVCSLLAAGKEIDLVVIQWSDMTRFETPVRVRDSYHTQYSMAPEWLQHRPTTALWASRDHLNIAWRDFYRECHAISPKAKDNPKDIDIKLFKKYQTQILSLNAFIQSLGIRIINMAFFKFPFGTPMYQHVKQLEWIIDPEVGMNNALENSGFELCKKNPDKFRNHPTGEADGHYEKDGHEQLYKWILDYIKNGRTVTAESLRLKGEYKEFDPVATVYEWPEGE